MFLYLQQKKQGSALQGSFLGTKPLLSLFLQTLVVVHVPWELHVGLRSPEPS